MLWQELAVAVIVGFSVVWLVRHMRSILVVPSRRGAARARRATAATTAGRTPRLRRPARSPDPDRDGSLTVSGPMSDRTVHVEAPFSWRR